MMAILLATKQTPIIVFFHQQVIARPRNLISTKRTFPSTKNANIRHKCKATREN